MSLRIIALSDTHMLHEKIKLPSGGVLVHAGDALNLGTTDEWVVFSEWWNSLHYQYKIFVPGNHDRAVEQREDWCRAGLKDTFFLIDQGCTIEGRTFWGTPWQPPFNDWAFNASDEFRAEKFALIPAKTDILVSHAPPAESLGLLKTGEDVGDIQLMAALELLGKDFVLPEIHICGHIHNSYGVKATRDGLLVNAAICNERYKPVNTPLTLWI